MTNTKITSSWARTSLLVGFTRANRAPHVAALLGLSEERRRVKEEEGGGKQKSHLTARTRWLPTRCCTESDPSHHAAAAVARLARQENHTWSAGTAHPGLFFSHLHHMRGEEIWNMERLARARETWGAGHRSFAKAERPRGNVQASETWPVWAAKTDTIPSRHGRLAP